jgi:hypothetical protein
VGTLARPVYDDRLRLRTDRIDGEGGRIEQARTLGHAWNGHGFEITFEGLPFYFLTLEISPSW